MSSDPSIFQFFQADFAAPTALSTSSLVLFGTWAMVSSVYGFSTSKVWPSLASTHLLLI